MFFPREQAQTDAYTDSLQPFPELQEEPFEPSEELEPEADSGPAQLIVDIKGAVHYPGVYTLQEGDRLIDAIEAAGGYVPDADIRLFNHAMKLTDEFAVYIPVFGEEIPDLPMVSSSAAAQKEDSKVNINHADEQMLMTIPGIGPAKASAIVQYRTDNGAFVSPEGIMEVSGIGQKTFENLEPYISVK